MVLSLTVAFTACGGEPEDNTGKYSLTYSRTAYIAEGETPETKYYDEGDEITLAPSTTFTYSGHTFIGWSDGTDTYDGGATYTMPAHNVKLRAQWEQNVSAITATSVGFEGDYFVFKGTVRNTEKLYVYLNNTNVSASNENYVQAEIEGNTFTARVPLSTLIGYNKNNTPFNLRYRIDSTDAEMKGVEKGTLDLSQTYKHNEYAFRLAVNSGSGCVAVYYEPAPDETVNVSATSIAFDDEYFVVTGTVDNVSALDIYLINTNVASSADNFVTAEITGNAFTARLPLSKLIDYDVASNIPFNLRYRANDSKVNVNIEQGTLDITQTHTYGGKIFSLGLNGKCIAVYYKPAPVEPEPGEPDYTFLIGSMRFESGKFIIEGTCGADVEKLIFHLNNTSNPTFDFTIDAAIDDQTFKAEVALDDIKRDDNSAPPQNYINVRYELNDNGFDSNKNNLVPGTNGDYIVGQEYRYGDKTWTLKEESGKRTYLNWSAVTDSYRITEVKLELVGETPMLTISGTTTDTTAAAQLQLLLDKTSSTSDKKYIDNTETETGKFSFTADLSDLIASANESAANKQQAYFIRLYNNGTKKADINSRWASDLLWERGQIETDDAIYFLMKNTEWSNTGWNTLGICKFDK